MANLDVIKEKALSKLRESISPYQVGMVQSNTNFTLPSKDLRKVLAKLENFVQSDSKFKLNIRAPNLEEAYL